MKKYDTERLNHILAGHPENEEEVKELASFLSTLIMPSVYFIEELDSGDAEDERCNWETLLHWCIHVGQSAWELSNVDTIGRTPADMPKGWEFSLRDLTIHANVLFSLDDERSVIFNDNGFRRMSIFQAGTSQQKRRKWDKDAIFTCKCLKLETSNVSADAEELTLFQQLAGRLLSKCRLYVSLLHWLVSTEKKSKHSISDCLINLFSIAYEMQADAVRLLWSI